MSLFPNDNLRRRSDFPGDSCGKCDRIAELERENEALRKDAGRYRWLRDQHEGLMPMEIDADGDLMPRELRALAFTVFYPDPSERESLVPVPIGDLDETIDAAIKENHAD